MKTRLVLTGAALAVCAGCVCFNETEIQPTAVPALPAGKSLAVQVAGFDAFVTTYTSVYGYSTVVGGDGWYGPYGRWYGGPYATTVATETIVPQASPTSAYRNRATETLEKCGYVLQTNDPQYRLEVTFEGPFVSSGDAWASFAWNILTLLTADYATQAWTAKLKIYHSKTGKLELIRDYEQRYEVSVWGPIPIFSPGACDKTKFAFIQGQCLTALTDRALLDAADFLSKHAR